ncbi:MAG TPA: cell division protein FtsA [Candidatus Paceibacterota bacterium]|nr:cell division protein FtsA [Candidatus Paceibacterota bacterium]
MFRSSKKFVMSLDFGTNSVKAIVGRLDSRDDANPLQILFNISVPSVGIRKGSIANIHDLEELLNNLINQCEQKIGTPIDQLLIGVNPINCKTTVSRGTAITNEQGNIISQNTVDRAINSAQSVILANNYSLLRPIPLKYYVDGTGEYRSAIGLKGMRLEADVLLVSILSQQLDDLNQIINYLDFPEEDAYDVGSLPAADLVLTKEDKELGAVAIDFGARTTSITVYEENNLVDTKSIPYGSAYLTDDIGICLQFDPVLAEKIKKIEGYIDPRRLNRSDVLNLESLGLVGEDYTGEMEVSRKKLAAVITARLDEIFEAINQTLVAINPNRHWPGGVTFYGGGSNLLNLADYARIKLGLPCKIATLPIAYSRLGLTLEDINAVSLLNTLVKNNNPAEHSVGNNSIFIKFKNWLKTLVP